MLCVVYYILDSGQILENNVTMNGWWSKLGVLLETKSEAVSCALHFSSIFSVYQEILGIIFGKQLLSRTLMLIDIKLHSFRFRVVTNIYNPAVWLTTTHPKAKQKMLRLLNSSYFLSKYGARPGVPRVVRPRARRCDESAADTENWENVKMKI